MSDQLREAAELLDSFRGILTHQPTGNSDSECCGFCEAGAKLHAALAAPVAGGEPEEFCWLAETNNQSHQYAVRGLPGHPLHLTLDPLEATRFATRDEALAFCAGTAAASLRLVPREHGFASMPAVAGGDPTQEQERPLGLVWCGHERDGGQHVEWHAPCGCAYHPEGHQGPHVHPCDAHGAPSQPVEPGAKWLELQAAAVAIRDTMRRGGPGAFGLPKCEIDIHAFGRLITAIEAVDA